MNTNTRRRKPCPWRFVMKFKKKLLLFEKKCFMKHGGQLIKQVSKLEKIFERPISPKPITQKKSQHIGIGSHLFYLNL